MNSIFGLWMLSAFYVWCICSRALQTRFYHGSKHYEPWSDWSFVCNTCLPRKTYQPCSQYVHVHVCSYFLFENLSPLTQMESQNHARIQKVLSEGVQLWQRFFVCFFLWGQEGSKYHYKRSIIGPPGVSLACRWWPYIECWLCSFVILRDSGPVLQRNPIFLWFFRGVGVVPTPCPPSGFAHENIEFRAVIKFLTNEGVNAKEIHRRMADVYGDTNVVAQSILQWQSGQQKLHVGETP